MECVDFLHTRRWYVCGIEDIQTPLMPTPGILQMRLYALYSLDKKILGVVMACFVAALSISGYILAVTLSKLTRGMLRYRNPSRVYSPKPSDSDSGKFAAWRDALLCRLPRSNILLVLGAVDGFRMFTLGPCRVQRFADFEVQWVPWSQVGNHSCPGFCCIFFRVSEQVHLFFSPLFLSPTVQQNLYHICRVFDFWYHRTGMSLRRTLRQLPDSLSAGDTYRRSHRLYHFDNMCSQ